jgi:hypothetical protein
MWVANKNAMLYLASALSRHLAWLMSDYYSNVSTRDSSTSSE